MEIPGFTVLLQDFCQYCPDFVPKCEIVDCSAMDDDVPKAYHYIRCINRKRCARIANNIEKRVVKDG